MGCYSSKSLKVIDRSVAENKSIERKIEEYPLEAKILNKNTKDSESVKFTVLMKNTSSVTQNSLSNSSLEKDEDTPTKLSHRTNFSTHTTSTKWRLDDQERTKEEIEGNEPTIKHRKGKLPPLDDKGSLINDNLSNDLNKRPQQPPTNIQKHTSDGFGKIKGRNGGEQDFQSFRCLPNITTNYRQESSTNKSVFRDELNGLDTESATDKRQQEERDVSSVENLSSSSESLNNIGKDTTDPMAEEAEKEVKNDQESAVPTLENLSSSSRSLNHIRKDTESGSEKAEPDKESESEQSCLSENFVKGTTKNDTNLDSSNNIAEKTSINSASNSFEQVDGFEPDNKTQIIENNSFTVEDLQMPSKSVKIGKERLLIGETKSSSPEVDHLNATSLNHRKEYNDKELPKKTTLKTENGDFPLNLEQNDLQVFDGNSTETNSIQDVDNQNNVNEKHENVTETGINMDNDNFLENRSSPYNYLVPENENNQKNNDEELKQQADATFLEKKDVSTHPNNINNIENLEQQDNDSLETLSLLSTDSENEKLRVVPLSNEQNLSLETLSLISDVESDVEIDELSPKVEQTNLESDHERERPKTATEKKIEDKKKKMLLERKKSFYKQQLTQLEKGTSFLDSIRMEMENNTSN